MVWISVMLIGLSVFGQTLPRFLTKHSLDSIRYISMDGNHAYTVKRPGVLGYISNFRSVDFLSESSQSDFLISSSRFAQKIAIEVINNQHLEFSLFKNNKILVTDIGRTQVKEIGHGHHSKLHLNDEWISYYQSLDRTLIIQNIITSKQYKIKLSSKTSPFFTPAIEMISSSALVYTDVNEVGHTALLQYNLQTAKSQVIIKSNQPGTRLELCQDEGYLAIGEFPYDDIERGSRILQIKVSDATNLSGFSTLYSSNGSDLGNMVCTKDSIYFVKTMTQNRKINFKHTEAARVLIKDGKVETLSDLQSVSQLINMDGRILIPFRDDFFVLNGVANLSEDKLQAPKPGNESGN